MYSQSMMHGKKNIKFKIMLQYLNNQTL